MAAAMVAPVDTAFEPTNRRGRARSPRMVARAPGIALVDANVAPSPIAVESVHLERLGERIDEPHVGHAMRGVDRRLLVTIHGLGGLRQHFADPIRRDREVRSLRQGRQALDPPASEVGCHRLQREQLQLRLEQDPPSSRAATSALKRAIELSAEDRRRVGVPRRRPRQYVQRSVDDLGTLVRWHRTIRVVQRLAPILGVGWRRHPRSTYHAACRREPVRLGRARRRSAQILHRRGARGRTRLERGPHRSGTRGRRRGRCAHDPRGSAAR